MARLKLTVEVRVITPALAKVLLDTMGRNRPLKPALVRRYVRAMKRGNWVVAEPLMISDEGKMIQGQHRCRAVIEANMPITFAIVSGYDSEACFMHIDKGGPRTFADELYIMKHEDSRKVAPMLGYYHRLLHKMPAQGGGGTPSDDEKWALTQTLGPDRIGAAVKAVDPGMSRIASRALMMALHLRFGEKDKLLADAFMSDLCSGVGLVVHDPVHVLRERLLESRASSHKARIPDREIAAVTIKAWNAVRAKRQITKQQLRWRSGGPSAEAFPVVE